MNRQNILCFILSSSTEDCNLFCAWSRMITLTASVNDSVANLHLFVHYQRLWFEWKVSTLEGKYLPIWLHHLQKSPSLLHIKYKKTEEHKDNIAFFSVQLFIKLMKVMGRKKELVFGLTSWGKACKGLALNIRCLELITNHRISVSLQQSFSVPLHKKLPDVQFIAPAVPVKYQTKIRKKHVFNFIYFSYFPVSIISTTSFKDCEMSQMGFCWRKWSGRIQQYSSDQKGSFTVMSVPIAVKINRWWSHWIKRAKASIWYKEEDRKSVV